MNFNFKTLFKYKTYLTKTEIRNFHRPQLSIPSDKVYFFSPPKPVKKKLLKIAKKLGGAIQTISDITLKDSSKFVLFEYSVIFFFVSFSFSFFLLLFLSFFSL